jgi:PAS domain S-box-containing protein
MTKILIIEDSRTTADYIDNILKKEMYLTVIAETGLQATKLIETTEFNLILLDLILPDISGIEILKNVRQNKSQIELPIIVLSAETDEQKIENVLELGANDFINKPISATLLKYRIRNLLQIERNNALKESEDKYKTLVQFMEIGVIRSDIHGNIVLANLAVAKMFGYNSPDEIIGMPIVNLYSAEQRNLMISELNKTRNLYNYEIQTKSKSNIDIYLLCNIKELVNENHEIIGREGILRDITHLKKTEQKLKENEIKLKELNATKDKFMSILAHDLRSPFTTLIGLADSLQYKIEKENLNSVKEYVDFIEQTSKNTYKLLENLFEWASSQQNRISYKPETINLQLIVSECYTFLNSIAEAKKIEIKIEIGENIFILADSDMTKTILRNLMTNAIKFTPISGKIVLSAKIIQPDVEITVSDTGVGMDEKIKNSLFKIGTTRSTRGTQGEHGTGFGLLLCKEFVEKHGGTIWVESEIGKGSDFKFTMPLAMIDNYKTT